MNAYSRPSWMVPLVLLAFSMPLAAVAQDRERPAASGRPSAYAQAGLDVRASKLLGTEVRNISGDNIGKIRDLIVDLAGEEVQYVVVSHGGALGVGSRQYAFPMRLFKSDGDDDRLVLDVDNAKIANAPGFDRTRWFDLTDGRYRREVDRYFGTNGATAAQASEQIARASELIGKRVNDRQGARAGEIEDLVVNPKTARVRYIVLDADKTWSPDARLVALPVGVFRVPDRKSRHLVLDMPREDVATARSFGKDAWPDLNGRSFRREVDAFLARYKSERSDRPDQTARRPGAKPEVDASSGGSR